jgi:hypothetical protein
MARSAVIIVLAAGGAALTAGAAQASQGCQNLQEERAFWVSQSFFDWDQFSYYNNLPNLTEALYWQSEWEFDLGMISIYTDRINTCNLREP